MGKINVKVKLKRYKVPSICLVCISNLNLIVKLSKHGSKWGVFGQGNTETRRVCIPASTYGIASREKGLVGYEVGSKIGQGGYKAGLPGWPIPPLKDWTREFVSPIQELGAGTKDQDNNSSK